MMKKSMAIVLSMALLLTILPLSAVYAALPTTAITDQGSTTAAEVNDGIARDDFEFEYSSGDASWISNPSGKDGMSIYPRTDKKDKNGNLMKSAVFSPQGGDGSCAFYFVDDGSDSGNQVLEIYNCKSNTIRNRTRYITFTPGQNIRFTYDICFPTIPTDMTSTNFLRLMTSYEGGIYATTFNGEVCLYARESSASAADANSFKPVAGKWYTVVGEVSTNPTDNKGWLTTYLIDKATQDIKIKSVGKGALFPAIKYLEGAEFYGGVSDDKGKVEVWLDNAELVFYTPSVYAPSVTGFSIGSNAVVSTSEGISVTFDQPIATPAAKFTDASGNEVAVTATESASKLNTYDISLATLEAGTTYTLDVSGFKNAGALGATENATITFSTEEGDIVKYTDAFENDALITTNKNAYNLQATTNENSPVRTRKGGRRVNCTYLSTNGYSGKALALKTEYDNSDVNAGGHHPLTTSVGYTPAVNNGEYESFVITYRFNIAQASGVNVKQTYGTKTYMHAGNVITIGTANSTEDPTQRNIVQIRQNYEGKTDTDGYRIFDDTTLYISSVTGTFADWRPIYAGKWYNVIWSVNGTNQSFKLVDAQTGELVFETERNDIELFDKNYFTLFSGSQYASSKEVYNTTSEYLIDDVTIYRIKPWAAKHALTATQSVSGTETVLTFNQPTVAGAKAFELYKGEYTAGAPSNTRIYATPDVTYPDFCQQKVSFDLDNLDYLTEYAIDYSPITAESGSTLSASDKASAVAEFATPAHPEAAFISSDIECSSLSAGGTITFDVYSKNNKTVDIIASLHKRNFPAKLETVEKLDDVSLSAGANTPVSIPLSKDIDADYIRIFAWDGTTLTPLMSDYEALAPVDTLNVLMIGSSLSEDTGRYFDNMLQAAGYNSDTVKNIDITVKGVGGGHFTYHAANLKRELAEGLDKTYTQTEDNGIVHNYITEQTAIMNGTAEWPGDGPNNSRRLYFTYKNGEQIYDREDNLLVTALMEKQYDIITLQPGANYFSDPYDDYEDALKYLTNTLREIQPNAEIMLFQTWSPWYASQSTRLNYFSDKIKPYMEKWAKNTADVTENVTLGGEPMQIIPSGYAFYLADTFTEWGGDEYNLDSGTTTAEAKGNELTYSNVANGLMRDDNHASFYGQYLSDAVWYETFTGKKAPATYPNGSAVIAKPTGKGPQLDENGKMIAGTTHTYFTEISDEEHIARLQMLSDIAHQVVEEYKGEFER